MSHKARQLSQEREKPTCYKIPISRDQAQTLTGITRDQGSQRTYYYCHTCDAWHTTSRGDAVPAKSYKRPSPGSKRRWHTRS